jgi:hypothetical protein
MDPIIVTALGVSSELGQQSCSEDDGGPKYLTALLTQDEVALFGADSLFDKYVEIQDELDRLKNLNATEDKLLTHSLFVADGAEGFHVAMEKVLHTTCHCSVLHHMLGPFAAVVSTAKFCHWLYSRTSARTQQIHILEANKKLLQDRNELLKRQ